MKKRQYLRKPHRYKRKKTIFSNRFFWLGVLAIIISSGLFYVISFSSWFQIDEIEIKGNKKVPEQAIQELIRPHIEQQIIFWEMSESERFGISMSESERFGISTKSIFLVNLKELEKNILNEFPLIANVEIERKFPKTIRIVIEERTAVAVWCQVLSFQQPEQEEKNCFLLDKQGKIFQREKQIQSLPNLPKIIDRENKPIFGLGDKVIREKKLFQILDTLSVLELEIKIPIKKVEIISVHKLTFKTLENWEIYFNLQADIEWQLTKLKAVLEEKIPLEKRPDLMYIELRFEDFASFKYRI